MKKIKISLILNILIVLLVTIGSIFMFIGFKFMPAETLLEVSKIEMFKFYTVDSNILIAIMSLILIVYEIKLLNKKIDSIPNHIYILKLVGTSAISLTFLVTAVFLTPHYGFYSMYNNNNLLFHLIVPLLAIISFVCFEKNDIKYRYALFGIIPMFLYSIYYGTTILIHLGEEGSLIKYDFYGFLQGDLNNIYIVIPIMYFIAYIISVLLVFFNRFKKRG